MPENPNQDYYYILRETGNLEPILIEYGFIDEKNDAKRLNENLENYAEGVVEALAVYIGYPYIEKEETQDYYVVKKGDTLYSISKKFNIPIDEIIRINNLNNNILSINQKIYLTEQNKEYDTYIVKKGDSLWKISREYDIPVNELIKINNLSNLTLQINQELLVPKKETNEEIYIVEKGDTLWSIAKKNNISVSDLKEINNLNTNVISIGQKLKIK